MFSKPKVRMPSVTKGASETHIGAGTRFEGTLESASDVFVAGEFKGRIKSDSTVVLNAGGKLHADVEAKAVVVHGEIVGNVWARERLEVGQTGSIKGDVKAGSARVTEGGMLDGTCSILPQGKTAPVTPREEGAAS